MTTDLTPAMPNDEVAIERIETLVAELDRLASEAPETWTEADLTMSQLRALLVLRHRQPMSVSALSMAIRTSLGSGSALVDRLVRMGLVRRREDPDDRRIVLLELDDAGQAVLDRLVARRRAHLRATLQRLSPADRQAVARALRILTKTMQAVADPAAEGTAT